MKKFLCTLLFVLSLPILAEAKPEVCHYGLLADPFPGYYEGFEDVAECFRGLQLSIAGQGKELYGINLSLFACGFTEAKGILIAPITGSSHLQGAQIGVFNGFGGDSFGGRADGLQLGVVNFSGCSWIQLGAMNAAGEVCGIQIGLFNYNEDLWKKSPFCLQFGLLNRTRSGWWLPLSNFGL